METKNPECYTVVPLYPPLPSSGDTFEDPQWMPETADNTKHYIYYVLFLYMRTYDKVYFINQAE